MRPEIGFKGFTDDLDSVSSVMWQNIATGKHMRMK